MVDHNLPGQPGQPDRAGQGSRPQGQGRPGDSCRAHRALGQVQRPPSGAGRGVLNSMRRVLSICCRLAIMSAARLSCRWLCCRAQHPQLGSITALAPCLQAPRTSSWLSHSLCNAGCIAARATLVAPQHKRSGRQLIAGHADSCRSYHSFSSGIALRGTFYTVYQPAVVTACMQCAFRHHAAPSVHAACSHPR